MCREELMNREDRKSWKHMAKQADKIHKQLQGQLSYTTEEWLKSRRNEK